MKSTKYFVFVLVLVGVALFAPVTLAAFDFFTFAIPNPSCDKTVTFTPLVSMKLQSASFWTSCYGPRFCSSQAFSQVFDASGTLIAQSDELGPGFEYTQNTRDVNYTTLFYGENQVILRPRSVYGFKNIQSNGNHCTDGPYHPDSAYISVKPVSEGSSPEEPPGEVPPEELPTPTPTPEPVPQQSGREPIVVIPGIMGSYLEREADGVEVWPNIDEMVFSSSDSYLDDLGLDEDARQVAGREMKPSGIIERESASLWGLHFEQAVYGNLIKELTDRGYTLGLDLFEVPYDWRLDLEAESARLAEIVEEARTFSANGKVKVIAHSMGGLLVKQYLAALPDTSFIDKVVLAGTPQLGAPAMFKALNFGDSLGFTIPVANIDLLNQSQIKDIAQNMPAVYELLPSRRYIDINGGYVRDFRSGLSKTLSYDETVGLMTVDSSDSRNPELLASAQDFHNGLDGRAIIGPRVYNVLACDNPATIGEVRLYDKGKVDIGAANGDGTVPLTSAFNLAEGYQNFFISSRHTGIDHGGLVRDNRAVSLIADLVEDGQEEVELAEGISTSSRICFPDLSENRLATFRFSSHGAASLHVYDSSGRHTGPTTDDNVESGIPGSSYEKLGDNSFVFVPGDEAYRIVAHGPTSVAPSLKVETIQGEEVVTAINYLEVPLAGVSSSLELVFSGADLAPDLALDQEGDGGSDLSVAPTSALEANEAADIMPPEINVSGLPPDSAPAGTPITVNFSATDDLSGVAMVKAVLDGLPVQNGTSVTVNVPGVHVFAIDAIDKAGNPRAFVSEFTVTVPEKNPPVAEEQGGNESNALASSGNSKSAGRILGVATSSEAGEPAALPETLMPIVAPVNCLSVPTQSLARHQRFNDSSQVKILQVFLNREFGLTIPLTGFFGPVTEMAVKAFQLRYSSDVLIPWGLNEPTGFVGRYTLLKMNDLACAPKMV